jgi:hypothetical protein
VTITIDRDVSLRMPLAEMPGSRNSPLGRLRRRRSDQTTSSAVTGEPSWNVAPAAISKRQRRRSPLGS